MIWLLQNSCPGAPEDRRESTGNGADATARMASVHTSSGGASPRPWHWPRGRRRPRRWNRACRVKPDRRDDCYRRSPPRFARAETSADGRHGASVRFLVRVGKLRVTETGE